MSGFVVSAPGKVIIHGEHAVVYGKKALAASLDLRTFMQVKKRNDGKLVLNFPDIALSGEWHVHDLPTCIDCTLMPEDPAVPTPEMLSSILDFLKFPSGTQDTKNLAVALFIYFYILLRPDGDSSLGKELYGGLSVVAASSIPTGAGLGSSAAYCVCLAATLLRIANVISEPQMSQGSTLSTWSEHDLCVINKWAFVGEKVIHGNASGIDNSVSCFGGIFMYQKGTSLERLTSVHKLSILLTNTKIPRSTRAMVANVAKRNNMFPSVVGPILSSIESISESSLKLLTSNEVTLPELYEHLAGLIEINQHLLAALGVSHSAINEVCEITAKHGLASKLTGAGGGGCVITLLRSGQGDQKVDDAKADLQAHMYNVLQTSLGSVGVVQHHGDDVATLAPEIRQHFH